MKKSLDSDTFEFAVEERQVWQQLDEKHGKLIDRLFAPFTDAVLFEE